MTRIPPLVYVAGPYRASNAWLVEQNIRRAEAVAIQVAEVGCYPITPHTNTRGYFEHAQPDADFWLQATLELMRRCDAVLMMPNWRESSGAIGEFNEAVRMGKPTLYTLDELQAWLVDCDAVTAVTTREAEG